LVRPFLHFGEALIPGKLVNLAAFYHELGRLPHGDVEGKIQPCDWAKRR